MRGHSYKAFRYGNCLIKWNKEVLVWQVWYCGEVIHYEHGTKPCVDYIRERRIAGELTHDAYRHLKRTGIADTDPV